MGKGSNARQRKVPISVYETNYEKAFSKRLSDEELVDKIVSEVRKKRGIELRAEPTPLFPVSPTLPLGKSV